MSLLKRLRRSERGAAALEFVIIAPALVLMIVGIARLGVLFMANAGLRNAVAEGARYATLYVPSTGRPTNSQIQARVTSSQFGLDSASFTSVTVVPGSDGGVNYVDITANYSVPMDFIFFNAGSVTLSETRRAFTQSAT
jgi:Flp pilus assembly protein TadG